ncbi:MAG: hypothetical protein JNM22_01590 [Saprospiraceae bacterium]|nr:hypothetical protein [Saprospiraceae bacterium]
MTLHKVFGAMLALTIFLSGCDKKEEEAIPSNNNECFFNTHLDSTQIANRLLGKWDWQYSFSGWTSQYSNEAHKGLTLEFKTSGVLVVSRNGIVEQTVNWTLQPEWQMFTEPIIFETLGPLYFCDDLLLFQGGAFDATNNYYKRK